MGMESKYIWMDGELVEFEKATVHVLNPAMHYGAAVFEGIRAYNTPKGPAVFRLREHAKRLIESAQKLTSASLAAPARFPDDGAYDRIRRAPAFVLRS